MYLQCEENLQENVMLASSLPLDQSWVGYQPQPEALEPFVELIGLHSFDRFGVEAALFSHPSDLWEAPADPYFLSQLTSATAAIAFRTPSPSQMLPPTQLTRIQFWYGSRKQSSKPKSLKSQNSPLVAYFLLRVAVATLRQLSQWKSGLMKAFPELVLGGSHLVAVEGIRVNPRDCLGQKLRARWNWWVWSPPPCRRRLHRIEWRNWMVELSPTRCPPWEKERGSVDLTMEVGCGAYNLLHTFSQCEPNQSNPIFRLGMPK